MRSESAYLSRNVKKKLSVEEFQFRKFFTAPMNKQKVITRDSNKTKTLNPFTF